MFDMGGVVTSTFNMDQIYEKLSMTKNAFSNICKIDGRNIWEELEIGKIQTQEFWKLFNTSSSIIKGPQVTSDLFRLYFHPVLNNATVSIINKLKVHNRVICTTNTIQSHWENHMERGDYSFFHQTYASNKIGVAKPSEEFFTTILEAENIIPSEAFFTDDKLENIKAAQRVGINAVHFTTAKDLEEHWKPYF